MLNKIKEYRNIFIQKTIERDLLKKQLKQKNTELLNNKNQYENLIEAQKIIQVVAQKTQNEIIIRIEDIVNLALSSIPFEKKPDQFKIEFVTRRNQSECDLCLIENGKQTNNIMLTTGGGVLSVISFALLIACWSLQFGKKCNTIIFDEPFKFINDPDNKLNLMSYISEMIKMISEKLNIQMIIVGNNGNFDEIADKLIEVKFENNQSKIIF